MPRRKKINIKPIFVSFNQGEAPSPHILDLEKLLNPTLPENKWQPSPLESLLSEPLKQLRPKVAETGKNLPKIKLPFFRLSFESPLHRPFRVKKDIRTKSWLPALKLPNFKFPFPQLSSKITSFKIHLPTFNNPFQLATQPYFHPAWPKAIAGFAIVALILVLPLKVFSSYYTLKDTEKNIVASGTEAFDHLNSGKEALEKGDLILATSELQQAINIFSQTQNELNSVNPIWRSLLSCTPIIGEKIKNGERLMLAGTNLTLASLPLISLFNSQETNFNLLRIKTNLEEIIPRLNQTNQYLMAVDLNFIPENRQKDFQKIRQTISLLSLDLQKVQSLVKNLDQILGENQEKTYLLVFQNNNEMRPTGGFLGSFAEVHIKNGKITKLDIPGEGSYQLQGYLKVAMIPPAPLQILKNKWEFQDANWFADFPTSAKKIAWFYEKSGGPTVDGVIALDTQILIDFLQLVGPVELPQFKKTLGTENAISELQKQIEFEYDKTQNRPKQIITELAPLLINKLFSEKTQLLPILTALNRNLNQKHLQIFLADKNLEQEIISQGWGGEVRDNHQGDYLLVVNSNVGGDKTDSVIQQIISHQTKIENDGSMIDEVQIKRIHQGPNGNPYTDRQNVDYIRFYVPKGSQLLTAKGFSWPEEKHFRVPEKWYKIDEDLSQTEKNKSIDSRNGTIITEEFGKTVFGNWVLTKPGQETNISISYRLPYKLTSNNPSKLQGWLKKIFQDKQNFISYSLLAQKQAGTLADQFYHTITWPENWKPLWADPENLTWQDNQSILKTALSEDKFIGLVFENQQ